MGFQSLALLLHMLQEDFDRNLRFLPEQIDEGIVRLGSFRVGGRGFQAVGCDLKLGRLVPVPAQMLNHLLDLIPLFRAGLEEFHSHPEFRVRDPHDASGTKIKIV